MKITIKRGETLHEYVIDSSQKKILLEVLFFIQEHIDPTLSFRFGCRSGVCGCCSVRVNGRERLACMEMLDGDTLVEPLRYHDIIKDLVVEYEAPLSNLLKAKAFLEEPSTLEPKNGDLELIEVQSDCILCSSCYSACPVLAVNSDFLGPFALTRVFRYVADVKEDSKRTKIDAVQKNGIWDCTLCGECAVVCPQGIDPKTDIINLRSRSAIFGYFDPNLQHYDTGGFGFNPF